MKTPTVIKFRTKPHGKHQSHDRRKKATNPSARKAVKKGPEPANQATAPTYKARDFAIDTIKVDVAKRRPVNPTTVKHLVTSIREIGLRTPLMVRLLTGVPHLVAGLQRLEAVKALGWKKVPCVCTHGGEIIARKCKIAENLHRGELTKLERAEQTAEWLELTESEERTSGETVQKKKGRPEGGDSKAARTLQIPGKSVDAKRKRIASDRKIAKLDPVVKEAAVEAGLDDDGRLEEIADEKGTDAQLKKIQQLKAGSGKPNVSNSPKEATTRKDSTFEMLKGEWKKAKTLRRAWENASLRARIRFVTKVLKYTYKGE